MLPKKCHNFDKCGNETKRGDGYCMYCKKIEWSRSLQQRKRIKSRYEKRKVKKSSFTSFEDLIFELDDVFRIFTRAYYFSGALTDTYPCFTCKVSFSKSVLQIGHFIRRGNLYLRWHVLNCHLQCPMCNKLHNDDESLYTLRIEEFYGPEVLEYLRFYGDKYLRKEYKLHRADVLEMIEMFKWLTKLIENANSKSIP